MIQRVQANFDFNDTPPAKLAFIRLVAVNDLLVVIVQFSTTANSLGTAGDDANTPGSATVTDTQGNTYTQIASLTFGGPFDFVSAGVDQGEIYNSGLGFAMFYAVAKATGACTVTVAAPDASNITFEILEFSGTDPTSPFDSFSTNLVDLMSTPIFNATFTSKPIPVTAIGPQITAELVIATFFDCSGGTFNSGYKDEFAGALPAGLVVDNTSVQANVTVQGTAFSPYFQIGPTNTDAMGDLLPTEIVYFSIGASFKPKTT